MLDTRKGKCVTITSANLDGLVRLLDEPDAAQADSLVAHLAGLADGELARLQERCKGASPVVLRNLDRALTRGQFHKLDAQWQALASAPRPSLEQGLTLICRTLPGEDVSGLARSLDEIADQVGASLAGDRAFDNGLPVLARVLVSRGLRGNSQDYYNPANSYLSRVLATGLGIPISLCCVAILVGQRLELPVHGIGSPGHFLGFYGDPYLGLGSYFDPFDGFRRLNEGDIQRLLRPYHADPTGPGTLRPASEREILARTLTNLAGCHQARQELERQQALLWWRAMLEEGNSR